MLIVPDHPVVVADVIIPGHRHNADDQLAPRDKDAKIGKTFGNAANDW